MVEMDLVVNRVCSRVCLNGHLFAKLPSALQFLPLRALLVAVHAQKQTRDDAQASVAQHLRGHWHVMKVDYNVEVNVELDWGIEIKTNSLEQHQTHVTLI